MDFDEADLYSNIIKAMSHSVRIIILDYIHKNKLVYFSELNKLFNLDKSTVSKHLLVLKNAGIISSKKKGLDMIYKLETPCIMKFVSCIKKVIISDINNKKKCFCN
jgi:ArsR family transcriptional regulator, arsenate/arsenite/antimonite-responsive transcriptional repressor